MKQNIAEAAAKRAASKKAAGKTPSVDKPEAPEADGDDARIAMEEFVDAVASGDVDGALAAYRAVKAAC